MSKPGRLWFPLDVDFWDDPDIIAVGDGAGILLQRLIGYAKRQQTDGIIPMQVVRNLGGRRWREKFEPLVSRGLVQVAANEAPNCAQFVANLAAIGAATWCQIVAYLAWNDSSEKLEQRRKIAAEKKNRQRAARDNVPQGQPQSVPGHRVEEESETDLSPSEKGSSVGSSSDAVLQVFEAWLSEHVEPAHRSRTKLTAERRKKIQARLKDYTADRLIAAIRGVKFSRFHMGENETGTKYTGLETILRDGAQVEKFEALLADPPKPVSRAMAPIGKFSAHGDPIELADDIFGRLGVANG